MSNENFKDGWYVRFDETSVVGPYRTIAEARAAVFADQAKMMTREDSSARGNHPQVARHNEESYTVTIPRTGEESTAEIGKKRLDERWNVTWHATDGMGIGPLDNRIDFYYDDESRAYAAHDMLVDVVRIIVDPTAVMSETDETRGQTTTWATSNLNLVTDRVTITHFKGEEFVPYENL